MKTKLLHVVFFVLLSAIGVGAKADVLVDLNACTVVTIGNMSGGGFVKGLSCPAEADHYIVYFVKFSFQNCVASATTPAHRVEGNCDNYVVYRIQ